MVKNENGVQCTQRVAINDTNEVVKGLFNSLKPTYRNNLETLMRGNNFTFDSVQLMYLQTGYKRKKATLNSKNTDHNCFQYAVTIALNYEEIESHLERASDSPILDQDTFQGVFAKVSDLQDYY